MHLLGPRGQAAGAPCCSESPPHVPRGHGIVAVGLRRRQRCSQRARERTSSEPHIQRYSQNNAGVAPKSILTRSCVIMALTATVFPDRSVALA